MKDYLLLGVRKFLETRLLPGKPVLLGYSGGPDSKALLYLLMECRRFFALDLHLAHVDHGWREESGEEALEIQAEADRLGLPIYRRRLGEGDFSQGNLEEQGRNHRLQFFSELYNALDCQALVLGHHAGDQAEVVLKRVFEGASLYHLGGLASDSQLCGMRVWRPLLPIRKSQVLDWLAQKNLAYFQDPTNFSKRFLRGRMREEMIPLLQTSFGKEVSSNLCRLGEESKEVREHFSVLNRPIIASVQRGSEMSSLDLNPFFPLPSLQLKYLLIEWMKNERAAFSRQILDGIVKALIERSPKKKFQSKAGTCMIGNGIIFLFSSVIQASKR